MTVYKDSDVVHDHTYYGNGCPNDAVSIAPCNTRIVKNKNNEEQKNGTFYHYQAATSGSGGAITTNNTNTPDTFCPLGWQLPYGGTGGDYYDQSRSWKKILDMYSISYDDGSATDATKIMSYPFSYNPSGFFSWVDGKLYYQNERGFYRSITIFDTNDAYTLQMWDTALRVTSTNNKNHGFALRCDFDISILEKLSMASAFTH